jgi:hypothetical protein
VGDNIPPGPMRIEWWNADTGALLEREDVVHLGGRLVLESASFQRHVAFKLVRTD